MDIQHHKKKPKTVLAYCPNSRDFHIVTKNQKSDSLQFRYFFGENFFLTVLNVDMLVNYFPQHLLKECVSPPTAISV